MRSLTNKADFCLYLIILMFFSNSVHSGQSVSLSVTVIGGKPNKGKIILSIFSSPENYLKQPVAEKVLSLNEKGEAQIQIDDLRPGTYAISTVYDEDENGKLNTWGSPRNWWVFRTMPKVRLARHRFGPHHSPSVRIVK